ncbi:phosphoribosyl-ATP diphosphatase [Thermopetrobacter sp. TC1]|uniref:phosphoribosyl-ATP diphosphatase n=1 Tax=Thermopetrobacter sp. TC1 TaxID=1495045 RepID=UPI00056E63EF|nr:phosphoribosyl-ATP diphosphatase [Thermopetrobacter sp. TC1]
MGSVKDHRLDILAQLIDILALRKHASPKESYTAKLLSQGVHKCAKKLGEESVELALALVDGKKKHVRSEAADVLYHFLVALMARGVPLSDVMEELQSRFGLSGLEEKARRKED